MKEVLTILVLVFASYAATSKITSFGKIDVRQYVNNNHALYNLYRCLVKKSATCDPHEADFKARGPKIVRTFGAGCTALEQRVARDLICLIGNNNPDHLHAVLDTFDPDSKNTRSFLIYLRSIPSLAKIPFLSRDVVNDFRDLSDVSDRIQQFTDEGGVLGLVGDLVKGVLDDLLSIQL